MRVTCSRIETERKWMHSKDMLRGELISCGYRLNIEMTGNKEKSKDCQGYLWSFPEASLSLHTDRHTRWLFSFLHSPFPFTSFSSCPSSSFLGFVLCFLAFFFFLGTRNPLDSRPIAILKLRNSSKLIEHMPLRSISKGHMIFRGKGNLAQMPLLSVTAKGWNLRRNDLLR